jgi:hypothetical protein
VSWVICQGLMLLETYGWPAYAKVETDKTTLQHDKAIALPAHYVETVDKDTGKPAFYSFGLAFPPIVFQHFDDAQCVIERFSIPNAKPEAWGR